MTRTTTDTDMKKINVVQSSSYKHDQSSDLTEDPAQPSEVIESNDETNFTQATDGYEIHA